jgi:hypothetical protein
VLLEHGVMIARMAVLRMEPEVCGPLAVVGRGHVLLLIILETNLLDFPCFCFVLFDQVPVWLGRARSLLEFRVEQVSKTPSWPRQWTNFSLF